MFAEFLVAGFLDELSEDAPQEEVSIVVETAWFRDGLHRQQGLRLGQETEMADNPTVNGADGSDARERPSWYVPIQPIPEDDQRTLAEVLLDTLGHEPPRLSEETQEELVAYLNQFRVPRES